MVAEGDFGAAVFFGHAVKHAAAQAAAQAAGGFAFFNHALNHTVGVFFDNLKRHAELLQVFRQHMGGKAGLFLIQIHCQEFKRYRCRFLQAEQNIQ